MDISKFMARGKVYVDRIRYYLSFIQFIMIAYLTVVKTDLNLIILCILLGISLPILLFIDFRFVMPAELNYLTNKNPFMRKLDERLSNIEKSLKKELNN